MSYFSKDDADGATTGAGTGGPAVLVPLSHESIVAVLDANELAYGIDDEGDIGGRWGSHLFFFLRLGAQREVFQVRGRWNRSIGVDQLGRVVGMVNEWNADKIWPKAYVRAEDGELGIYAETSTDLEYGATKEQLDQLLSCGIGTGLQLFEWFDEAYPEAVAHAEGHQV